MRLVVFIATLGLFFPFLTTPLTSLVQSEEEYEAAMKEINLLVVDAELHIDARYWPELHDDIRKLRTQFEAVEAFWSARGEVDAVSFARQSMKTLEPIASAADERNPQAAESALEDFRSTCQSCHEVFRDSSNGGYRIKP